MKIGLIHNLYGPSSRGGAEVVVRRSAEKFLTDGHEVFIISGWSKKAAETRDKGVKIYYLKSTWLSLHQKNIIRRFFWHLTDILSPLKYQQISHIIDQEKPELVITHNLSGLSLMAPGILQRRKIRHEHFLHDIQLLHPSGLLLWGQEKNIAGLAARIYQRLTRHLLGQPDKVISPSRWLLSEHQKCGFFNEAKTEICPLQEPQTRREISLKHRGAARRFLFVGQVEEHKGIFFLLQTFKKIPSLDLELSIIGDGSQLEETKKIAESDKRISLLGRLDPIQVQQAMSEHDYLIVPSLCYENSPSVIYEAHHSQLPVIAAKLGGIPEITGVNDQLFVPGDEDDLIRTIQSVI